MTAPRTRITKPVKYRDFIITPRADGFDMIDPVTGRWAYFPTQRFAKWSASFLSNIHGRMSQHPPKKTIPPVQES